MKRVSVCDILSTLFRVCFFNPLFKHRYQADLEAPRPPPPRGCGVGRTPEIRDAESGADIKIRKQY